MVILAAALRAPAAADLEWHSACVCACLSTLKCVCGVAYAGRQHTRLQVVLPVDLDDVTDQLQPQKHKHSRKPQQHRRFVVGK